jgi:endonuclease YncB( thermonuclease family)
MLIFLRLALLSLFLAIPGLGQEPIWRGSVVGISDGDTIKVLTPAKQQIRVRIAFIDCPETGQAFGSRAKQAMSELVFGKDVELRPYTIDRYGRLVAVVYIDGIDTGLDLLTAGLAWPYYRYLPEAPSSLQDSYRSAAERAKAARLGLWSDPEPIAPWEWRYSVRKE